MTTAAARLRDDFDSFYLAHFGDTVAMAYGFTADLPEAQDIAQEAFARAWQRWKVVSGYENPVAWVRRVAVNLARSRWRRVRVATSYLLKQRPEEVPELNPDHIAVVAALRKLPAPQREAIVMHHMADVPVDEIAAHLDVPVGTVKSWLHRGRAALASDLAIDVQRNIKTPPTGEVVELARKRRRAQIAAVAAIVAALLAGVVGVTQLVRMNGTPMPPTETPSPVPTPSPTPTPSINVNDPMNQIDWATATITFGLAREGCPSGPVTFRRTEFEGISGPAATWPKANFLPPGGIILGDLSGDGLAEAVLNLSCMAGQDAEPTFGHLLIVTRRDGALHALAWAGRPSSATMSMWISGGVLYADTQPRPEAGRNWDYRFGAVDGWRWTGNAIESVNTTATYPALLPGTLDLTPVAAKLRRCGNLAARDPRPAFDQDRLAQDGDREWMVNPNHPAGVNVTEQLWAGLDRPNRPYFLLAIGCRPTGSNASYDTSLVLFDGSTAIAAASDNTSAELEITKINGTEIEVVLGQTSAKFVWNGTELMRAS